MNQDNQDAVNKLDNFLCLSTFDHEELVMSQWDCFSIASIYEALPLPEEVEENKQVLKDGIVVLAAILSVGIFIIYCLKKNGEVGEKNVVAADLSNGNNSVEPLEIVPGEFPKNMVLDQELEKICCEVEILSDNNTSELVKYNMPELENLRPLRAIQLTNAGENLENLDPSENPTGAIVNLFQNERLGWTRAIKAGRWFVKMIKTPFTKKREEDEWMIPAMVKKRNDPSATIGSRVKKPYPSLPSLAIKPSFNKRHQKKLRTAALSNPGLSVLALSIAGKKLESRPPTKKILEEPLNPTFKTSTRDVLEKIDLK